MLVGAMTLLSSQGNAQGRREDTGMAPAQAADSAPVALILAVFPGPNGAQQAMRDPSMAQQLSSAQSYAVVSKDKKGKVNVQKRPGQKGRQSNARANNAIDGAIALLGKPPQTGANADTNANPNANANPSANANPNANPSANAGAQPSGAASQAGMSQADADKLSSALPAGNSAIILVVDDPSVAAADSTMSQAHAQDVTNVVLVPVPQP
jgi:hypothetical protein